MQAAAEAERVRKQQEAEAKAAEQADQQMEDILARDALRARKAK